MHGQVPLAFILLYSSSLSRISPSLRNHIEPVLWPGVERYTIPNRFAAEFCFETKNKYCFVRNFFFFDLGSIVQLTIIDANSFKDEDCIFSKTQKIGCVCVRGLPTCLVLASYRILGGTENTHAEDEVCKIRYAFNIEFNIKHLLS